MRLTYSRGHTPYKIKRSGQFTLKVPQLLLQMLSLADICTGVKIPDLL
jgi:hypothetical protein